jgi:anti-sigma factor RsiW
MNELRDPVTDADLDAYVDDQLDVARRIEVEAFLSARPEAAARVMSDLRTRRRPMRRGGWNGDWPGAASWARCSGQRRSQSWWPRAGWRMGSSGRYR